jgi:predicted transcriptional regulator
MRTLSETSKNQAFLSEVRERRRVLRVPQKVLAAEMEISVPAYHKIENGATDLKFDIFNFLCKRLGIQGEKYLN